jgi:DNA-binding MarR family transcriptional regulator
MQPTSKAQAILEAEPGSDEALARDLGLLVRHLLGRSNRGVFAAFAEHDLSFTQAKILMALAGELDPRSIKSIADELGVSLPATSRAVDGLLKRGFVTRTEDPDDRRVRRIALTDAARRVSQRMFELRATGILDFVAELEPAERRRLADALASVVPRDAAEALVPVPPTRKDPAHA